MKPHAVKEVYLAGTTQPDTWVDITDTLELKIKAVQQHISQIKDPAAVAERLRERARQNANGRPPFAEGFRRLVMRR